MFGKKTSIAEVKAAVERLAEVVTEQQKLFRAYRIHTDTHKEETTALKALIISSTGDAKAVFNTASGGVVTVVPRGMYDRPAFVQVYSSFDDLSAGDAE